VRTHLPVPNKRAEALRAAGQFGRLINFYRVLGLRPGADHEKIKTAYRRLVKRFHPDVNAGDARAAQRTKDLIQAYQTLSEPEARSVYDLEFARQRGRARKRFVRSMAVGVAASLITAGPLLAVLAKHPLAIPRERTKEIGVAAEQGRREVKLPLSPAQAYRSPPEDKARSPLTGGEAPGAPPDQKRAPAAPILAMPANPALPKSPQDRPPGEPVISTPSPAMPRMKPAAWVAYTNARLGFTLRYPANVFEAGNKADNDDRLLTSKDGRAVLRIFAATNKMPTTISEYRRSLIATRYADAKFDYAPQRQSWFVLSGSVAEEMFYERVTFSCDRRSLHGWLLVYPLAERSYFDAIVEEMHRSYRHVAGSDAPCGEIEAPRGKPAREGKSRRGNAV
jgi:curved DNA-binding protein CbpA